ncbi:MAG: PAS domain S-box protein, partial [Chloroflexota bacterium]
MTDKETDILLVEDNPGDARLVQETLAEGTQNHYGLECAGLLTSALQTLTNGKIDLVLLDLGLPDSNGLETLNKVYEHKPEVPIVVLTGMEDEALGAEAVRNGAQDYLSKSEMESKELWRVIRYAMERKRAEAVFRLVEARLQHLVTRSPAIIFALRVQNGEPEVTFISDNIREQLDHTPADFIGNYEFWKQCVHQDDLPEVASSLPRLLEEGAAVYEYRFRHKDGTYRWLRDERRVFYDAEGKPAEIVGSWVDTTDRRSAEEALKQSEEKYRSLLNNVRSGVVRSTPGPKGKFLEVNPAMEEITGYSREELLQMNVSDLYVYPEQREHDLEQTAGTDGKTTRELEFRKKDGTEIVVSDTTVAVRDDAGEIMYFDGIIEDITERKRAEQQIKSSLEEKEMLLKEIHHRVKNNMQVISSLLRLQERYIDNEAYVQMFRESQNRIQSMSLVHQKLYQSDNLATIDFGGFVSTLANTLLRSYGVDVDKVTMKIESDDVWLGIDSAIPCGLIINELVSNSLKYAFSEGQAGEISIGLHSSNGNELELVASDNGVGIPEGLDFKNTDSLGLQLVMTLVRQLRGDIELDRTEGTKFRI